MFAKSHVTFAIAAVSALYLSTAAVAGTLGEATPDQPITIASTVSRGDVQSAALAARAGGAVVDGERSFVLEPVTSVPTRAQVVAETIEAARLGVIGNGEQSIELSADQIERIGVAAQRAVRMTVAAR
jgi:hypothetical protein